MQSPGAIKYHIESPYENLDPHTVEWLNHLKQIWNFWKKNEAVSDMLFAFFSTSLNPFKSALQLMISCGDFHSAKQNSLAYHIIENFSNWLQLQSNFTIPREVKLDALDLAMRQKNFSLVKLVAESFKMVDDKEIFIEPIRQMVKNNRYKEACYLASLLNLHELFSVEEFLVPLVFQDKYEVAEQFLKGSKRHQVELAMFLDNVIGKKSVTSEAESIIKCLKIFDARLRGLNYKPLSKLLVRIIKTFNLPSSTCPNLNRRRVKGVLHFLMHKRYVEKTIGNESWCEMVLEAIGDDVTLQEELIQIMASHGDFKEALAWAERFGIEAKSWPSNLQAFTQREEKTDNDLAVRKSQQVENKEEAKEETSKLKFHKLSIQESQIKLIDTESSFCNCIIDLSNGISIIGIDAEWKPSFGLKKCDLALIQIAAFHVVYILDVITLASAAPQVLWERFANVLFESPNILKLGFGINTDLGIVKETFQRLHGIKTGSYVGFLDLALLWRTLVRNYKFVFPFVPVSKNSENLNCLIEMCLGESLDKSDQFSNWEKRPLRRSQIVYAALDAYCLLEAYNVIAKESESQNIPISDVINEIVCETASRQTVTKKKKGGKCHQDG